MNGPPMAIKIVSRENLGLALLKARAIFGGYFHKLLMS